MRKVDTLAVCFNYLAHQRLYCQKESETCVMRTCQDDACYACMTSTSFEASFKCLFPDYG